MKHKILAVEKNSIAEEMGLEAGDFLVSINRKEIIDILDYRFLSADEEIELLIEKKTIESEESEDSEDSRACEEWLLEIDKDLNEDIGIVFESGLIDSAKSCKNKCIFCFIDQLPKGLRETMYFKDDDSRLSFLSGNYVTLTNMSDHDIDRIIYYHLSPINISVHTTDPELRYSMLKNPGAKNIVEQLTKLKTAGISMNFQIVLCKDVNDGVHLDKTISDLAEYIPLGRSLSVVPVGITKYRDENGLYKLTPFDKDSAEKIIRQIGKWQKIFLEKFGDRFVYASDEFYLKADKKLPAYDEYDDFPQLENGVGMISLLKQEFYDTADKYTISKQEISIATGTAAYKTILEMSEHLMHKNHGLTIFVHEIKNDFFGHEVTVSGLLTGHDIIKQLRNKKLGRKLLLPINMLRAGENTLLDDVSVSDIERELEIPVQAVEVCGEDFIKALMKV